MPISRRRRGVDGASLVCSVDSTRWPVRAASMAIDAGLAVADLAHEHDVGVLAEDRAQRRGEREPGLRVRLDLVDVGEAVLDGILDRDDVPRSGR